MNEKVNEQGFALSLTDIFFYFSVIGCDVISPILFSMFLHWPLVYLGRGTIQVTRRVSALRASLSLHLLEARLEHEPTVGPGRAMSYSSLPYAGQFLLWPGVIPWLPQPDEDYSLTLICCMWVVFFRDYETIKIHLESYFLIKIKFVFQS